MGSDPVTRRAVLKTTGVAGGLAASFQTLPEQVGAAERKQNIVVLREGEEVAKRVSVGQRWYRYLQHARKVLENRQDQLLAMDGVHGVGLERRGSTIDGLRKQALTVHVEPGVTIDVPGEFDGVEVRQSHEGRPEPAAINCYDVKEDPIPGGVAEADEYTGNSTLCCRGFKNGSKYVIAARHTFTSDGSHCNSEDVTGREWHQPDVGDRVGEVAFAWQNNDVALLDTRHSSRTIDNTIHDETGEVVGRVTKDGMDYIKSNNLTLQKRGLNNCREAGNLLETGMVVGCSGSFDFVDDVARSSPTTEPGDSGGPVYYEEAQTNDTDKLYLANIASFFNDNDETLGASANSMYQERGVTFGGNPYSGS